MCPACVATVALIAAKTGSAAGVAAFFVKKLLPKGDAKDPETAARAEQPASPESTPESTPSKEDVR
jgi:hypothetical protein